MIPIPIVCMFSKHMNFLDKNTEILFQTMQHSDIEQTATCISQVFSNVPAPHKEAVLFEKVLEKQSFH